MIRIASGLLCVACTLSLWSAFAGFLYCAVYKKKRSGALWYASIALFALFFAFLAAWGILRNMNMPSWNT